MKVINFSYFIIDICAKSDGINIRVLNDSIFKKIINCFFYFTIMLSSTNTFSF